MNCSCCGGTVPQGAQCCPHCGAAEYRGLWVLSPRRPALWIGSVSGFLFGVLADAGDKVLPRLLGGLVCAVIGVLVCGLLAWTSFPGRKPKTCKHCGGTVALDAGTCPHCGKPGPGSAFDRELLALGASLGTIGGFIYGVTTASGGLLFDVQNGIVFAIVGGYAGALLGLFELL